MLRLGVEITMAVRPPVCPLYHRYERQIFRSVLGFMVSSQAIKFIEFLPEKWRKFSWIISPLKLYSLSVKADSTENASLSNVFLSVASSLKSVSGGICSGCSTLVPSSLYFMYVEPARYTWWDGSSKGLSVIYTSCPNCVATQLWGIFMLPISCISTVFQPQ